MPLDQAHEQHNATVKGSGGAVGLTENPVAFNKWMVAGPEQERLVLEFEGSDGRIVKVSKHLETDVGHQKNFRDEVSKLVDTVKAVGNPFLEEGSELLALDSHECFADVADTISNIKDLGKDKYKQFKETVLEKGATSIHQAIKRNNLPLFKKPGRKFTSKLRKTLKTIKQDCNLFSHLYISSQVRASDMDAFFRHENVLYPPSLSDNGVLRLPTKKSDLLDCLDTGRILTP